MDAQVSLLFEHYQTNIGATFFDSGLFVLETINLLSAWPRQWTGRLVRLLSEPATKVIFNESVSQGTTEAAGRVIARFQRRRQRAPEAVPTAGQQTDIASSWLQLTTDSILDGEQNHDRRADNGPRPATSCLLCEWPPRPPTEAALDLFPGLLATPIGWLARTRRAPRWLANQTGHSARHLCRSASESRSFRGAAS